MQVCTHTHTHTHTHYLEHRRVSGPNRTNIHVKAAGVGGAKRLEQHLRGSCVVRVRFVCIHTGHDIISYVSAVCVT